MPKKTSGVDNERKAANESVYKNFQKALQKSHKHFGKVVRENKQYEQTETWRRHRKGKKSLLDTTSLK